MGIIIRNYVYASALICCTLLGCVTTELPVPDKHGEEQPIPADHDIPPTVSQPETITEAATTETATTSEATSTTEAATTSEATSTTEAAAITETTEAAAATTESPTEIPERESNRWITQRAAPIMEQGGRYIFLTFDDGPSANTPRILDILADCKIKGTFFFLGNAITSYGDSADVLQRVLAEGHFIGLHSMTHNAEHLYRVSGAHRNFYNEMRRLQTLIHDLTGGFTTNLYRAPYGTRGTLTRDHIITMNSAGFKCWDWNVDTEDWRHRTVSAILSKIQADLDHYNDPDIVVILFHEHNITLEALPAVIKQFLNRGFTFLPYHPDNHFSMNIMRNPDL